jgi:hypothetical protein
MSNPTDQQSSSALEVVSPQHLQNAAIRQNTELALLPADVLLQLEREVELRPMAAQLEPRQLAVIARVVAQVGSQIEVF